MNPELITLVGTGIQTAGVWALTVLMLLVSRALGLRYLRTWAMGWLWLSGALAALQFALRLPGGAPVFQPFYHFGELAFLWCLGLGFHQAAGGVGSGPDFRLPASLAALLSLSLPLITPNFTTGFVIQASLLCAGFTGACLILRKGTRDWGGGLGIWITQISLILLSANFGFHAVVLGCFLGGLIPLPPAYSGFTSLYDFLFEMLLAFGLVVLAMQDASSRIRTLTRLLPVCAWCRKIRDDQGYWKEFELWVKSEGLMNVTHGICPSCKERALEESVEGPYTGREGN